MVKNVEVLRAFYTLDIDYTLYLFVLLELKLNKLKQPFSYWKYNFQILFIIS